MGKTAAASRGEMACSVTQMFSRRMRANVEFVRRFVFKIVPGVFMVKVHFLLLRRQSCLFLSVHCVSLG